MNRYTVWFRDVEQPVDVEAKDRNDAAHQARSTQANADLAAMQQSHWLEHGTCGKHTAPSRYIERIEKIVGLATSSAD